MRKFDPQNLIYIGLAMILLGIIFPMLMVMQYLKSTFFLNFFSYGLSVLGLMLGVIGMAYMVAKNRRQK